MNLLRTIYALTLILVLGLFLSISACQNSADDSDDDSNDEVGDDDVGDDDSSIGDDDDQIDDDSDDDDTTNGGTDDDNDTGESPSLTYRTECLTGGDDSSKLADVPSGDNVLPDLAIEADGTLHVVHGEDETIVYNRGTFQNWEREVLPCVADGDLNSVSLALDQAGSPHAVCSITNQIWGTDPYYAGTMYYLEKTGDDWTSDVVFANPLAIAGDLALDPSDKSLMVFDFYGTMYAEKSGNNWLTQRLDMSFYQVGASLALTPDGEPRALSLSYHDIFAYPVLIYFERNEGTWTDEILDEAYEFSWADLAVDSAGVSHLLYENQDAQMVYATREVDGWQEDLVGDGESPARLSFATDDRAIVVFAQDGALALGIRRDDAWQLFELPDALSTSKFFAIQVHEYTVHILHFYQGVLWHTEAIYHPGIR